MRSWHVLLGNGQSVADLGIVQRPSDALPDNGDVGTPWYRTDSHLHGKDGRNGIHFYGTEREAQEELRRAWRGESDLPVDDDEFTYQKESTVEKGVYDALRKM